MFRTAVLPAEYSMQSFAPGSSQTRADAAYTQVKAGSYQALQCADGQKGYVLDMQDKQDLGCSMSYENWLYSVNGTDMTSAAFEPDGSVSLSGENISISSLCWRMRNTRQATMNCTFPEKMPMRSVFSSLTEAI